ncbi:MAG: SHOCT domain-containing protein [Oryzihumus sp.]
MNSITAVRWKSAGVISNGSLSLILNGGDGEAGILFSKNQMAAFEALRNEIEQAIAAQQRPSEGSASAPDHLAQLRQLGDLRDAGILSEEELSAKKALILSRL